MIVQVFSTIPKDLMSRNRIIVVTTGILLWLISGVACNGLILNTTSTPVPTAITVVDIPYAKIIYYDVNGSTERDLREQLNAMGPVGPDGYHGDALTSWHVRWTWDGYGAENCDLRTTSATYDIKVTMPRWVPPEDVSPALIEKWNQYMLALTAHENVHVENVIANLPVVINAIRRASCSTAEAKAQEILAGIRQNDMDFDTRTDHGSTQGARFP
jgi:predicted secreted Zn-dependent protease